MKKYAFVAIVLALVCVGAAHAVVGVGVQGDAGVRIGLPSDADVVVPAGAALTLATDALPWVFAVQVQLAPVMAVGFTADNWVVYQPLAGALNGYAFWGISGGGELEDARGLNTGARLGVGANLFLFRHHLELYAQLAWNPYFGVNLDTEDADRFFVMPLSFPASAGVRLWF